MVVSEYMSLTTSGWPLDLSQSFSFWIDRNASSAASLRTKGI